MNSREVTNAKRVDWLLKKVRQEIGPTLVEGHHGVLSIEVIIQDGVIQLLDVRQSTRYDPKKIACLVETTGARVPNLNELAS